MDFGTIKYWEVSTKDNEERTEHIWENIYNRNIAECIFRTAHREYGNARLIEHVETKSIIEERFNNKA